MFSDGIMADGRENQTEQEREVLEQSKYCKLWAVDYSISESGRYGKVFIPASNESGAVLARAFGILPVGITLGETREERLGKI